MKYLYLITTGNNTYKLGLTKNIVSRVNAINSSNPQQAAIISSKIVADDYTYNDQILKKLEEYDPENIGWMELNYEQALGLAILINKQPEIDISTQVNLRSQINEQKLRYKSLEKKLDILIGIHSKPRVLSQIKSHAVEDGDTQSVDSNNSIPNKKERLSDEEEMELAWEACLPENKASTSLLQRKLRIGYGKAARIIELMEKAGWVSGADGARPRKLLRKYDDSDIVKAASELSQEEINTFNYEFNNFLEKTTQAE